MKNDPDRRITDWKVTLEIQHYVGMRSTADSTKDFDCTIEAKPAKRVPAKWLGVDSVVFMVADSMGSPGEVISKKLFKDVGQYSRPDSTSRFSMSGVTLQQIPRRLWCRVFYTLVDPKTRARSSLNLDYPLEIMKMRELFYTI